jgi:hypothetical protein
VTIASPADLRSNPYEAYASRGTGIRHATAFRVSRWKPSGLLSWWRRRRLGRRMSASPSAAAGTRLPSCNLIEDPARLAWMGRHAAQWTRQAFDQENSCAQLTARRLL